MDFTHQNRLFRVIWGPPQLQLPGEPRMTWTVMELEISTKGIFFSIKNVPWNSEAYVQQVQASSEVSIGHFAVKLQAWRLPGLRWPLPWCHKWLRCLRCAEPQMARLLDPNPLVGKGEANMVRMWNILWNVDIRFLRHCMNTLVTLINLDHSQQSSTIASV